MGPSGIIIVVIFSLPFLAVMSTTFVTVEELEKTFKLLEEGDNMMEKELFYNNERIFVFSTSNSTASDFINLMTSPTDPTFNETSLPTAAELDYKKWASLANIGNPDYISNAFYPQRYIDRSAPPSVYYFWPAINMENKALSENVAFSYLLTKFTKASKKVKILVIVDYSELIVQTGPTVQPELSQKFSYLLKKLGNFLSNNVYTFWESFALIVTYEDTTGLNQTKISNNVASALGLKWKSYEKELIRRMNVNSSSINEVAHPNRPSPLPSFEESQIELLNIILHKDAHGHGFTNLGFFTLNSRRNLKQSSQSVQLVTTSNNKALPIWIHKKLNYFSTSGKNFGTVISEISRTHVDQLIQKGFQKVTSKLNSIAINFKHKIREEIRNSVMNTQEFQKISDHYIRILNDLNDGVYKCNKLSCLIEKIWSTAIEINSVDSKEAVSVLAHLTNYIEYFNQIGNFKSNYSATILHSVAGFKDLTEIITTESHWYEFLTLLNEHLSDYRVQKDVSLYNVQNVLDWGQSDKPQGLVLTNTNFKDFLQVLNTGETIDALIKNIEKITFTPQYLKEVNEIIELNLKEKVQILRPSPNSIQIKGNHIVLSDFLDYFKASETTVIEVFATRKIFVDTDILRDGYIQIALISPYVEVISSHNVILTNTRNSEGKDKPRTSLASGKNGEPGAPGFEGGSFLVITLNIKNGAFLNISSLGGKGGDGQEGSDGAEGRDGTDAPMPKGKNGYGLNKESMLEQQATNNILDCRDESINYMLLRQSTEKNEQQPKMHYQQCLECLERSDGFFDVFYVYEKSGFAGGNGGHGGKEGIGGYSGNITILELLKSTESEVVTYKRDGSKGQAGLGGKGGVGGYSGKRLCVSLISETCYVLKEYNREKYSSGRTGLANYNDKNQVTPKFKGMSDPIQFLNNYKSYALSKLDKYDAGPLKRFLNQMDSNPKILELTKTTNLVKEIDILENYFYSMQNKTLLRSFYESLLRRISLKIEDEKNFETKNVLKLFQGLASSRMITIKNGHTNNLIVNILDYIESSTFDIESLKESINLQKINKLSEEFRENIQNKISEGNFFIEDQIKPEIDRMQETIDNNIYKLLEETVQLQTQAQAEKAELIEKKAQLEAAMKWRFLFGFLKICFTACSFLGPIGTAVGAVGNIATGLVESLALDGSSAGTQSVLNLPAGMKSTVDKIGNAYMKKYQVKANIILKETAALNDEIEGTKESPRYNNLKTIQKLRTELNATINADKFDFKAVEKKETELKDELKKQKSDLKKDLGKADAKAAKIESMMGNAEKTLNVVNAGVELYQKVANDQDQIAQLSRAIEESEQKFQNLKQFEYSVFSFMIPMVGEVSNKIEELQSPEGLRNKSIIALDVSKWQIQRSIRDMKFEIKRMTKGTQVEEEIAETINKLDEAMTVLINVYDRIDQHNEQTKLTDYIAAINSPQFETFSLSIKDPELHSAVQKMLITIRSNLVVWKYQNVLDAFQQWMFPFAYKYLNSYNLISNLESNSTIESVVGKAVGDIKNIRSKILEYKSTIVQGHDENLLTESFNSDGLYSRPFYTWSNRTHGKPITDFLQGKEISLYSNVLESTVGVDAIKFNLVNIKIHSNKKEVQEKLNELLSSYFQVKMVHMGNSYYRCNDKYYVISGPSQSIEYGFAKGQHGQPTLRNKVYDKIKVGDLMLSPYATWKFTLIKKRNARIGYGILKEFFGLIDLQLVGTGVYTKAVASAKDWQLDEFYTEDESILMEANDQVIIA